MFKKYPWLWVLIAPFLIGFIFSFLVVGGYWFNFTEGMKRVPWFMYILGFYITFFITLTIHELSHLITFVIKGTKIRALYLHMLVFYKTTKGWRVKIKPKLWFLMGGFVVPDLGEINDDETYQSSVDAFRHSLIVAPYVTIVFLVMSIIIFMMAIAFGWNPYVIGFYSLFTFYTAILSFFYIKSFKLSNQWFYGDFVAYQKMKDDLIFQIVQMSQYRMFSLKESKETDMYLFNKVKEAMRSGELKSSLFYQLLILNYIEAVTFHGFEEDPSIREKLTRYPYGPHYHTEQGVMLLYDLAVYYYHLGMIEKSYQLIEQIRKKASPKIDEKSLLYLRKKHDHILHIQYDQLFLDQKEHVKIRNSGLYEDLIDLDEMIKEMHEPLDFKVWETKVELTQEENEEEV